MLNKLSETGGIAVNGNPSLGGSLAVIGREC
jgi:hypothetical protein